MEAIVRGCPSGLVIEMAWALVLCLQATAIRISRRLLSDGCINGMI
jgi:hypothetical protein